MKLYPGRTLCWLRASTTLLLSTNLHAATLYVDANSANPISPYTNWATAARLIHDAVAAAVSGDTVLVTNGVYAGGLAVSKPLTLLSVNGPQFTIINGGGTNRCVLVMSNPTTLSGFTLTNGCVPGEGEGGGLLSSSGSALLTQCVVSGNCASNGGGVVLAVLNNCLLTGNSATGAGGAAYRSTLRNCTVVANSAAHGGGASDSSLNNSIIYDNTSPDGANYSRLSGLTNSCTTPDAHYGAGNITNAPLFVDSVSGNFHLQATSPCVNAGNNAFASGATDLDGNPRIAGCAVDMGAYEFQQSSALCIFQHPVSQTVYSGTNVVFTAGVSGIPPFTWQWWFNDAAILDATNSTLTLTAVTTNQTGNYSVVVTNTSGSATSRVAVLTVTNRAPLITQQPLSQTVNLGSEVTLTATAIGSIPMTWQWQFQGSPIPDATNSSLKLFAITPNKSGNYSVAVTNAFGWATSQWAVITVTNGAPVFTMQPLSQTTLVGSSVTFTASVSGVPPFSWQWWSNGVPLSGASASSLAFPAVTSSQAGNYFVVVTNSFGSVTSQVAVLTVLLGTATSYVWQGSPNPTPPYDSWNTAAHVIQDAVDSTASSGTVLVTNGTYALGGRQAGTSTTNRVTVDRPMTLRSVNGPKVTVIQGYQMPGVTNGSGAIRCVSLGGGAVLSGFTLTNGGTSIDGTGGGIQGGWYTSSSATNCVIVGNSAYAGGGAYGVRLVNCLVTRNSAQSSDVGGYSAAGGGTLFCALNNCTVVLNSAGNYGGGIASSPGWNSIIYYNTVANSAYSGTSNCYFPKENPILFYCCFPDFGWPRVVGNIDTEPRFVSLADADFRLQPDSPCINAGDNAPVSTTTDLDGNPPIVGATVDMGAYEFQQLGKPFIAVQPASQWALPASNVTFAVSAQGFEPLFYQWLFKGTAIFDATNASLTLNAVTAHDAGGYSVIVTNAFGSVTSIVASLTVWLDGISYVWQNSPNPTPPYGSWLTAAHVIEDAIAATQPGGLVLVTNGTYAGGLNVSKPITVQSVSGPQLTIINGGRTNRCVSLSNDAVLSGFTLTNGWARGSGEYGGGATGGTLSNCTLSGNSDYFSRYAGGVVYSTLINCTLSNNVGYAGGAAYSTLINCFLTGGRGTSGGGAAYSTLYQCTLIGNWATNGGGAYMSTLYGCTLRTNTGYGAAAQSTLYNCTLTGNSVGAVYSTLYNCTLTSNYWWGAYYSTLYNCVLYYNTVNGNYVESTLNNCCTIPMPATGSGNITNAPRFVSLATGDFRLQPDSPCINAGNNAFVSVTTDLDGNPRIVGGTVDIGAYEFQLPASTFWYAWLQQFGLPTDGSVDSADPDGDGYKNWQEWLADTNPTNKLSVLRMLSPVTKSSGLSVSWQSVTDRTYFLERATNLGSVPAFFLLRSNLTGQPGTTSFTDTNAAGAGPFFYRVGVQE